MRHLFSSVVQVQSLQLQVIDGEAVTDWAVAPEDGAGWLECRLDLQFLRPGRDVVAPINAGVAPDRFGVMFCFPAPALKTGRRIVTIDNAYGQQPVQGTFEIKTIPDVALDFTGAHHVEVQIIESVQQITKTFGFGEEIEKD